MKTSVPNLLCHPSAYEGALLLGRYNGGWVTGFCKSKIPFSILCCWDKKYRGSHFSAICSHRCFPSAETLHKPDPEKGHVIYRAFLARRPGMHQLQTALPSGLWPQ